MEGIPARLAVIIAIHKVASGGRQRLFQQIQILRPVRPRVTGYSMHVVPAAIDAWPRHPTDFRTALVSVLECGGDTYTVGAILDVLAGATVGKQGIPVD